MPNTLCSVAFPSAFDAKHDITWSFKYCLSGNDNTTGVFSTFLYNASALRYTALSSISGNYYSVDFNSVNNSLTVNGNVSAILPFTVKVSSEIYNVLRFQFTDVGQTLNVYHRSLSTDFTLITSLSVGGAILSSAPLRVGVSYRTPITGNKARFRLKDLHVQGIVV